MTTLTKLRRSRLLAGISTLGAVAARTAPISAAQFDYKLAHGFPVGSSPGVRMVQMCDAIKSDTNGRMQIQVFPNFVLGTSNSMLAQLRLGSLQFMLAISAVYTGVVPVAAIESVAFAFKSKTQPCAVLDGALGAYLAREYRLKGFYLFEKVFEAGFRQVTSSTKPIKTVDDFNGFKLRTAPAQIFLDLFKTLGASPIQVDTSELYVALQTHLVDGQETSLDGIEYLRLYEVQKYMSLTSHAWNGYWLTANVDAWNALPSDVQAVVTRNVTKYALLERNDVYVAADSLVDKLRRQGLALNAPDPTPIRARLGPYYARWKDEFGATAWSLLEAKVGKLG